MKYPLVTLIIVVAITLATSPVTPAPAAPPSPEAQDPVGAAVETAISEAIESRQFLSAEVKYFDLRPEFYTASEDGAWASGWVIPVHPLTGEDLPTEPALSLAVWDGETWTAYLPRDPEFRELVETAPGEILPEEALYYWASPMAIEATATPAAALGGYLLPWEHGKTVYLSRSTAHDEDIPSLSAHYAFDFYVPQTMFNLHAARSGTVWLWRDTIANGDPDEPNYLVLQDTSTSPVTYQLYLHLAQNSIPEQLKTVGAPVAQGQFIGIADDTGVSTGHHLHFQVETNLYGYWGRSVDITFDDVDINGGRPRVSWDLPFCTLTGDVCQAFRSAYISGNQVSDDQNAPWGDLFSPETGLTISTNSLQLSAWVEDDDSGIAAARFKAYFDGEWRPIGPTFATNTLFYNWDLCAEGVPDGPLSLALEIRDVDGNNASGLPGLRHVLKDFACPSPPSCEPAENQVAIFSNPDFSGECSLLGTGDHGPTSLSIVGDNSTSSIKVGGGVWATLFANSNLTGRGETFFAGDRNLLDNLSGSEMLSSLQVASRTTGPNTPAPFWPANSSVFSGNPSPSLSLAWDDRGGAVEFQVKWDGADQPWQRFSRFQPLSISVGTHTWQVRARNPNGTSNWSSPWSFSVEPAAYPPTAAAAAPFTDNMESGYQGWTNSNNWDQTNAQNHTDGGAIAWGYEPAGLATYDTGIPNYGDLTSPAIQIGSSGYWLTFWYYYETESPGIHWDQRWVQISVDGGPFSNLLQLSDDPPNVWLRSPAIDLSSYTGHTIRVRFHFETLDQLKNNYKGWFIDDFAINQDAPASCQDSGEPDNSASTARAITYNSTLTSQICPAGDVDYYRFSGQEGDRVGMLAQALIPFTPDTYLFLLDSDGSSVLAENDDRILGINTDSYINYRLPHSGDFTIKVRAWNHPTAGGPDHNYHLSLFGGDDQPPTANLANPPSNTFLANGITQLLVSASDNQAVHHVDFFWHAGDWLNTDWIPLSTDWDGTDGWSHAFDSSHLADQKDMAFYAQVYDQSGNSRPTGSWNLWLDRTAPETSLQALQASSPSTAVLLHWSGTDNLAGIDHYDIQRYANSAWSDWQTGLDETTVRMWYFGQPGDTLLLRMRGVDRIGNSEAYPSAAEANTLIPVDVCATGDVYEDDNRYTSAKILASNGTSQQHSFCNIAAGSGGQNDVDWLKLQVAAGQRLFVRAVPSEVSAAAHLQLYAANGSTLLAENRASDLGQTASLDWLVTASGTLYLRIAHTDQRVWGDGVLYQITAFQGEPLFLPAIFR